MKPKIIKVKTKSKNYEIHIGINLILKLKDILKKKKIVFSKCLIVFDSKIPKKFRKLLFKNFKNQIFYTLHFNANEKNKNYLSVDRIHNSLFKNNFYRDDCVISFGGGITGDVVGYAASTFKRGIKFINIPSTLLAQVDSSIGGKTGINNRFGKNLVGSFYQPDLVISDINLLNTLPKREIICGYAEILKSSLVDNKKKFIFLDKNFNKILNLNKNYIMRAILNSCLLKKKIIEKDEKENNLRKSLNLGHTFAHAYEATLKYSKKLNHGEAVIFGLMNAVNFSKEKKIISRMNSDLINNHIKKIEIKSKYQNLFDKGKISSILNFMRSDKKNQSDSINLILIRNFGKLNLNYQAKYSELNKFLIKELYKAYL